MESGNDGAFRELPESAIEQPCLQDDSKSPRVSLEGNIRHTNCSVKEMPANNSPEEPESFDPSFAFMLAMTDATIMWSSRSFVIRLASSITVCILQDNESMLLLLKSHRSLSVPTQC